MSRLHPIRANHLTAAAPPLGQVAAAAATNIRSAVGVKKKKFRDRCAIPFVVCFSLPGDQGYREMSQIRDVINILNDLDKLGQKYLASEFKSADKKGWSDLFCQDSPHFVQDVSGNHDKNAINFHQLDWIAVWSQINPSWRIRPSETCPTFKPPHNCVFLLCGHCRN